MPRRALTDRSIASLTSCGKLQFEHFDGFCPGLLLRVSASGKRVWDFAFRSPVNGKRARMRIGPYPAVSLAVARERAMAAQAKIADKRDPRAVDALPAPKTIAELIEDRLALVLRDRTRSAAAVEWRAQKYIIPLIGGIAVADFKIDPNYNRVIDPLLKRNRVRTAGLVFQDLRALFNFAIQRGIVEYSRISRIKRPDEPVHRTRFLSREEIAIVWNALPTVMFRSEHIATILRLCLATAQRLSEVAGMRRSEIDLESCIWLIPGKRTKNGYEHSVPLGDLAVRRRHSYFSAVE